MSRNFILPAVLLLLSIAVFSSCGRPRVIPDKKLGEIFREFYLANAYFSTQRSMATDSMDIYRPILRKHGYTLRDFRHTVNHFTRRKSSRLSDVLEKTIADLQAGFDHYEGRVAVLDTIEARALRMSRSVIMSDSMIRVTSVRDTSKLRIVIPVMEGAYRVSYRYFIDSLDRNTGLRTTFSVTDAAGKIRTISASVMRREQRSDFSTRIETKAADSTLQILFGNYPKDLTTPRITIDSLTIVRYPPLRQALDSLNRVILNINLPFHVQRPQTDSSPLRIPEPETHPVGGGNS